MSRFSKIDALRNKLKSESKEKEGKEKE